MRSPERDSQNSRKTLTTLTMALRRAILGAIREPSGVRGYASYVRDATRRDATRRGGRGDAIENARATTTEEGVV